MAECVVEAMILVAVIPLGKTVIQVYPLVFIISVLLIIVLASAVALLFIVKTVVCVSSVTLLIGLWIIRGIVVVVAHKR